jgi:hypothetical protein
MFLSTTSKLAPGLGTWTAFIFDAGMVLPHEFCGDFVDEWSSTAK